MFFTLKTFQAATYDLVLMTSVHFKRVLNEDPCCKTLQDLKVKILQDLQDVPKILKDP